MRLIAGIAAAVLLLGGCASAADNAGSLTPSPPSESAPSNSPSPEASAPEVSELTKEQCSVVWYEYQYAGIAPGFPVEIPVDELEDLYVECQDLDILPSDDERIDLTQKAFNTTAQILEQRIYKVSKKTGKPLCEVLKDVLKPVAANGAPLQPGDDVEGYAPDSFLPITKYNWLGGPFRLKWAVGCDAYPWVNLWLFADPYPPEGDHPDRYPTDAEVEKDPWSRYPVQGPMSTCITWGPDLGNDGVGGRGFIFGFEWDRTNHPLDVRSCYPKALGLEGLDKYPFEPVPNL